MTLKKVFIDPELEEALTLPTSKMGHRQRRTASQEQRKNKREVKRENIKINVGPPPYIGGISERTQRAMKKHQISTPVRPKVRRLAAGAKDGTGQKTSNNLLIMQ